VVGEIVMQITFSTILKQSLLSQEWNLGEEGTENFLMPKIVPGPNWTPNDKHANAPMPNNGFFNVFKKLFLQ
jgi:hypothetical protein